MKVHATSLPGCARIELPAYSDMRGSFVKTFHAPTFAQHGLSPSFVESYYSTSRKGVIRGLHFQVPPADHVKLVYCIAGRALDVVVDLREGSPTYGKFELFELSPERPNAIYIPPGLAHGFLAQSDATTLVYLVSTVHSPAHDCGIRWDSAGIPWGVTDPVVSERDAAFPSLAESPPLFRYPSLCVSA